MLGMRTGKTTGMPPRTAFVPSRIAPELRKRFSLSLFFHEVTVAPYKSTSTESPVGKVAVTLDPSECTEGCGPVAESESADGLCDLSTMVREGTCFVKRLNI